MTDALDLLSRYIQFDTSHHNEMAAAQWLAGVVPRALGSRTTCAYCEPEPGRGLVIARIQGRDAALKPLIVNHHIDVVAADPAQWTHPPFGGEIADGVVYGRGAFDDKGMGVAHLLALDELVREGARFRRGRSYSPRCPTRKRTAHRAPAGSCTHMARARPGVGVGRGRLGVSSSCSVRGVLWGVATCEKQVHRVRVTAQGTPGHGSMPHTDNPNDKLIIALRRVLWHDRPSATVRDDARRCSRSIAQTSALPCQRVALTAGERRGAAGGRRAASERSAVELAPARHDQPHHPARGLSGQRHPRTGGGGTGLPAAARTDPDEFDAWLRGVLGQHVEIEVLERSPRTPSGAVAEPALRGAHRGCAGGHARCGRLPLADARRHRQPLLARGRCAWLRPRRRSW